MKAWFWLAAASASVVATAQAHATAAGSAGPAEQAGSASRADTTQTDPGTGARPQTEPTAPSGSAVQAQSAPGATQGTASNPESPDATEGARAEGEIIVTARNRAESLKNVPVAVTAISGDTIKQQQLVTVRDIAQFTPGLNINSDSASRAFVSIRGIGTTLIDTVQPGVGIFIDGIYQPNTSYLNSPLVDVARVEVLRGPQGTVFGNNTLGGAINVITRQPSNEFMGRLDGALATGDNFASVSASVSGPVIKDLLQVRIGGAYNRADGFQRNLLAGGDQNPLETKSVGGTVRFLPAAGATFTLNANYDRVFGGATPYFNVAGPRDYTLDGRTNQRSLTTIDYYGVNLKGEFALDPLHTQMTVVGAYNEADTALATDADFSPVDLLRGKASRKLKTYTGEARFDTKWSDSFSTLIGAFVSRSTLDQLATTTVVPLARTVATTSFSRNNSQAVFGTAFLKIDPSLDLAVGLRYDHQELDASQVAGTVPFTAARYKANEVQPRITLTKRWNTELMTYASISRGVRGGGQNGPGAPNLVYRGDNVWTYEVGSKATAFDRALLIDVAAFYNDYRNFIGQNALAPSTTGAGFVSVNLNSGTVHSYGVEAEASWRVTQNWRLYGNATLLHARVTDSSQFRQTTGYNYPGNRILFVPDATYTVGTNLRVPFADRQSIVFDANITGKSNRVASSLDETSIPVLSAYKLVNGSIGWHTEKFEIAVYGTNLLNEKYIETFIDKSLLRRAGLPAVIQQNLAIQGVRRRVGLRGTIRF